MTARKSESVQSPVSLWQGAVTGLIATFVALAVILVITSIGAYFFEVHGQSVNSLALGVQYAAALVGGAIGAKRVGKKGITVGGTVGLIFSLLQLASNLTGGGVSQILSADILFKVAGTVACGALGGVIGVNF